MNAVIAALVGAVTATAVVVGGGQAIGGASNQEPVDSTSLVAYSDQ